MDLPQAPGDVLAQPTRAQLFALLAELRRPASTDELAEAVGLHPNGVRAHLERLLAAQLVERERTPRGRGRPRDMWRIGRDARPGGAAPTGYADVAAWLARALAAGGGADGVEEAGRRIGRDLAPAESGAAADGGDPERRLFDALVALGFRPERERRDGGRLAYRLCNCPYRDVVRGQPAVVCGLHRGITRGLLDALDPASELAGFVARDPYAAGCEIEVAGPLAAQPTIRSSETAPKAASATTVASSRPT